MKSILSKCSVGITAAFLLIFMSSCTDDGRNEITQEPPLQISFRTSLTGSGSVMILQNTATDKELQVRIYRDLLKETTEAFSIQPEDEREFGVLQIGSNFHSLETGYVSVDGYREKLHFKLDNDGERFKSWFDD